MDQDAPLTLALETAILSGSIALTRGQMVLASEAGPVARASDILISVQSLLRGAGFTLQALKRVAVSVGPGSYTGVRVGIATVAGLSQALQIQAVGVPVLKALAASCLTSSKCAAAVPVGAGRIALQQFANAASPRVESSPYVIANGELATEIRSSPGTAFVLAIGQENDQFARLVAFGLPNVEITSQNLAELVGQFAAKGESSDLEPIYL